MSPEKHGPTGQGGGAESPQEGPRQAQALAKENPKRLVIVGAIVALLILWRLLRR